MITLFRGNSEEAFVGCKDRRKPHSLTNGKHGLIKGTLRMAEQLAGVSQLEEAFHLAAERIAKNKRLKVGTDEKLKLYSYFKQVSIK